MSPAAIETRTYRLGDAFSVAQMMRSADVDEVMAATGETPSKALVSCVMRSAEIWTLLLSGEIAAMYGVAAAPELSRLEGRRVGLVWMLTTTVVEDYKKDFVVACAEGLPGLFDRWDVLINAIDKRHTRAIRWARRLGFEFRDPRPMGSAGLDFCQFRVTKEMLCAKSP